MDESGAGKLEAVAIALFVVDMSPRERGSIEAIRSMFTIVER